LRERDTLDERLKNYTAKEQEALVNQEQAESSSENVRVISYATRPRKGRNMRLVMFVLASAGWGFTLFVLAMMKVFLDPKLYAGNAVPTTAARSGRRDDDGYAHPAPQQPHQDPVYAPPAIPESIPMPAAAFAAAPYAAAGHDNAPVVSANPYGAQPYEAGQNYDTEVYADPYAQQPMAYQQAGYGNAAPDLYANPYAPVAADAVQTQVDMHVLGTVPSELV